MDSISIFFKKIKKPSIIATIVLLSLSAAWGIFLILFPPENPLLFLRIIGTTTTFGVFLTLIASSISRFDSYNQIAKVLAWITMISGLVATILLLLFIWGAFNMRCDTSSWEYAHTSCYTSWQHMVSIINKILWFCIILTFSTAIDNRYLSYNADNTAIAIFRNGTLIINTILSIVYIVSIFFEIPFGEPFAKFMVICGILLVLGLIVTPILALINKNHAQYTVQPSGQVDEKALRAKIEQEVRAKIAAEQAQSTVATPNSADSIGNTPSPSEPAPVDKDAPFA